MNKVTKAVFRYKKPVVIACAAAIVGISVWTDVKWRAGEAAKDTGYLFTADEETLAEGGKGGKILGEARLVDTVAAAVDEPEDAYFSEACANRERSRSEALETLQVVIDSSETMPDVKDEALRSMVDMASRIECEAVVEEMVKAKGFEDCVAVMRDDGVNVVVKSPGLLPGEVAQITEIVMEETGLSPEEIKIVERR